MDPTAPGPPASNFARHRRTVPVVVSHPRAIDPFDSPSAASSNAQACTTTRYGNDGDDAIRSNSTRSTRDTFNGAAISIGTPEH